jgi:hypothetical protein
MIDCIKTVSNCVRITQGVLATLTIHGDKMKAALTDDMLATDIAAETVRKAGESKRVISALPLEVSRRSQQLGADADCRDWGLCRGRNKHLVFSGSMVWSAVCVRCKS